MLVRRNKAPLKRVATAKIKPAPPPKKQTRAEKNFITH
jgi:hypothetical protein